MCYGFKIKNDKLIKVMIGLAEPMRGQHNQVPFDEPKERKD
jgi:hypothetical protein